MAEQGHEGVVLERFAELGRVGAGALVQPPGQLVLNHLESWTTCGRAGRVE